MACGRRFGKTGLGLLAVIRGHGPDPAGGERHFKGAIDGATIWWVAPSYPTIVASEIWSHLKLACQGAWSNKSEVDKRIEFGNGGSITIRSADNPDSLRGPGLDGLFVDEAAFLSVEAWEKALRPALSDKQGWCIFASTPNGRNWFHDLFKHTIDWENWERWQLPSSCNPLVTGKELEQIKRTSGPRVFAQEHEAQFTEIEGALWPGSYFDGHIWATSWPDAFERSAIAVDPSMGGSETGDYSAIVFVGLSGGLLWVDCSIERRTPGQIVEDTTGMHLRLRSHSVGCESNGFQAVLGTLFDNHCRDCNLPPLPLYLINNGSAGGSKATRIQRLDPYLANGKFQFRDTADCHMLVEQLQMFPTKGFHDDGPDALEMAVRLLGKFGGAEEEGEERVVT